MGTASDCSEIILACV